MGIGSVTSTNNMSGMQMITAASTDPKIKNTQNKITDAKREMQKLSSKEDLSVNEKADERKKLQKEISSLNAELKQYQEELSRSQERKKMLAELREGDEETQEKKSEDKTQTDTAPLDKADEKNQPAGERQTGRAGTVITQNNDGTVILKDEINQAATHGVDADKKREDEAREEDIAKQEAKAMDSDMDAAASLSRKEMLATISADSSVQQAGRLETIISNTRDGIAILKGEMNQDERRGVNTERKQAELEEREKKEQRATIFQSSILGGAMNTMRSAAETNINVAGINDKAQDTAENNAYISALKISQEEQAQQRFYVSVG